MYDLHQFITALPNPIYHWNGNAYYCLSELAIATVSVEPIYRLKHFPTIIPFKIILGC